MPDATRRRTLRPVSAGITFWLAVAIGVWAVSDAARGGPLVGLRWGAGAVLVLWVLWLVLWSPSLRIRDDRLEVVNGLRTWTIPWTRVEDVEARLQYVIVLDDGRAVTAWGSPFSGRATGNRATAVDLQPFIDRGATGERPPIGRRTAWWSLAIPVAAVVCLTAALAISPAG